MVAVHPPSYCDRLELFAHRAQTRTHAQNQLSALWLSSSYYDPTLVGTAVVSEELCGMLGIGDMHYEKRGCWSFIHSLYAVAYCCSPCSNTHRISLVSSF